MKRFLLFVMLILVQTLSAQIYSGKSNFFAFSGEDDCDPRNDLGYIRHYITPKGESTYFSISLPGAGTAIDISKNSNVRIDYNDGTFLKTKVHSSEVCKLSKPYAKEKFYVTLIEFPIERNELCNEKRIRKILIERDCGEIYIISVKRFTGLYLNKEFPGHFETAMNRAIADCKNKQQLADAHRLPEHLQLYIVENYPNHSYSLALLDTVHMPFRQIQLLDYSIKNEHGELANKIEEARSGGEEYTHFLEQGDSIVKEFDEQLISLENKLEFPLAARGDQDDYQRAIIVLVDYDGKKEMTLYTRVGETTPTPIDPWQVADKCSKSIADLEELINWLRRQQEQRVLSY